MRKLLFILLFLVMGMVGASAQSNRYDVNADGNVNITDVIELVNYILGLNNGNSGDGGNETNATGEAIDLGLPSGTNWARCNVGATKPEEYGGYYAWGETEEKETYKWETYIHCNGTYQTCHNIGSDISGTQYDVAYVKWGGQWRMPTSAQFKELYNNCTSSWTTLNGVKGYKFISKINGNNIFLPAAGYITSDLRNDGVLVSIWSSSLYNSTTAYGLDNDSSDKQWKNYFLVRSRVQSVRPVMK